MTQVRHKVTAEADRVTRGSGGRVGAIMKAGLPESIERRILTRIPLEVAEPHRLRHSKGAAPRPGSRRGRLP